MALLACGAACVGEFDTKGLGGSAGSGPSPTSGTGGMTGGDGKIPNGTGGASSGSGGSSDGTGGAGAGSGGGTPDGSGGAAPGSGGSTSGSGGSTSGSGGSTNGSGGATNGSGGATSGSGGATSGSGGSSCVPAPFPPDVQALLSSCSACHGSTPLAGAPALVTYANLTASSASYPTQTNAQRALVRLQSTTNPMPPAGSPRPTANQVSALQAWVDAGYPMTTCPSGSGGASGGGGAAGGAGGAGGTGGVSGGGNTGSGGSDPFAGPSVCTSKTMWTSGNRGSASMNPGKACITCHSMGEGPTFAVAGTLYPTAHEPDLCNGSNGSTTGARIVITDKNGKALTLTPNTVGNFSYQGSLATPFTASVTYMGRERKMLTPQTNGDCNACHTTSGAMSAPGRILLP